MFLKKLRRAVESACDQDVVMLGYEHNNAMYDHNGGIIEVTLTLKLG